MVDIYSFWHSLKCTWVRRLLVTDAFLPEIFRIELAKNDSNIQKIVHSGPSYIQNIAKRMKNRFWQNCLFSLADLSRESAFSIPVKFYLFSIFQNPLFKFGRRALPWNNFGNHNHRLELVTNFYKSHRIFYSLTELNELHRTNMTQNQLNHIQAAIQTGLATLNLNLGKCDWHPRPRQSCIIAIANQNIKGCRAFYRIFRARANLKDSTCKVEEKWHAQLNANLSVTFWNNVWRLHASMQFNNQLKWLQYQVLRNCLFTHNRVSKFKLWITDLCDLCGHHIETPLTLFTECTVVRVFWSDIKDYLDYFGVDLPIVWYPP